ncbi:hypothetical protein ALP76_01565 [Pseudomonas savastanoi pv. glycinea]|uniref:hypothetical protein n=1 Tax=Pseudomonas savastanoi TaxID=29438 RepID=UPI0006B8F331|nr:hypothetical protein [Pseudomonas savastanoi]MBN4178498.1 hypothetical protein [Pseudomonas savastanoi pv. phaseolicola]RMR92604.1 hypothetical protein ALP76_01565 [Pseudomonas savastanoi pv. glycinea]
MSSKINVKDIVYGHIRTLSNVSGEWSWLDFLTFCFVPLALSVASVVIGFSLNKDVSSLLVNFGAIFTALLLSVLVLVFDQESKLDDKYQRDIELKRTVDAFYTAKKKLLDELYYNISFSILSSLVLITTCFAFSMADSFVDPKTSSVSVSLIFSKLVFTPLAVFITVNLLLTIIMIVKRLHSLLRPR